LRKGWRDFSRQITSYENTAYTVSDLAEIAFFIKAFHLIPQVLTLIVGLSSPTYYRDAIGLLMFSLSLTCGGAATMILIQTISNFGVVRLNRLILPILLQAVPLLDVISAFFVWRHFRKKGYWI